MLYTVPPYFCVFGLFYCLKSVAMSEKVVVMERFDLRRMFMAVEEFRVTDIAVAPLVVVAMTKSDLTKGYDLMSLGKLGCGGAPLGKVVMAAFTAKFPSVMLWQGYGLTESTGANASSSRF
uniref:AMP-dependent synthetase/ligase domain-containing protein n=1 Tax=Rhizophora mucronata TaxID=61149 RepID=A0A2P2N4G3_RHIMU